MGGARDWVLEALLLSLLLSLLARELRKFVAIRCPHLFMHVFLTMWQMVACHPSPCPLPRRTGLLQEALGG